MNSINFFADQTQTGIDKFLVWSLSYGRAIVMITELIALLAFLYRFNLDRELSDLHDSIKQHQIIVAADKKAEDNFRSLQKRLLLAKTLDHQAQATIVSLVTIISQTNGNVQFTTLNFTDTTFHASAIANSTNGLNTFVTNVRNLPFVSNVSIDSIHSKQNLGQVSMDMTITILSSGL